MFNVSNNDIITITRGDTGATTLVINLGTNLEPIIYDLGSQDKVYFGVCEPHQSFEDALIKKVFTAADYNYQDHDLTIPFFSKDTEYVVPGVYYYTIKLYRPATTETAYKLISAEPLIYEPYTVTTPEKIDTLIDRKKFIILD